MAEDLASRLAAHARAVVLGHPGADFTVRAVQDGLRVTFDPASPFYPGPDYAPEIRFDAVKRSFVTRIGRVAVRSYDCPLEEVAVELRGYLLPGPPSRGWEGTRILDIGPYTGFTACYLAKLAGPGTVVCLEPDPEARKLLAANILLNELPNVRILPAAWARETEMAYLRATGTGESRLVPDCARNTCGDGTILVQTLDLPDALAAGGLNGVDYIKCDIEGGERDIARPLGDYLAAHPETLAAVASYHPLGNTNRTTAALLQAVATKRSALSARTTFPLHQTTYMARTGHPALSRLSSFPTLS